MNISTAASIVIPKPREEVFDFAVSDDMFESSLRPLGPIAGIAKSQMHEGHVLETGAHRRLTMTDGVVLEEEIIDFTRPSRHEYQWIGGLKPPFSLIARSGRGSWVFTEVEGGTRIDFSYAFELTSPLAYPAAAVVVAFFKRWMMQGLNAIKAELVARPGRAATPASTGRDNSVAAH